MNILEFLSSMKAGVGETMKPVTDRMDSVRGKMADMVGDDREQFSKRMQGLASASAAMSPRMPAPPSGAMRPQVKSSPAPVMGAAPNPYAPVTYDAMRYQSPTGPALGYLNMMRNQSPTGSAVMNLGMMRKQSPTSGIGAEPTIEQILKALQSRGL